MKRRATKSEAERSRAKQKPLSLGGVPGALRGQAERQQREAEEALRLAAHLLCSLHRKRISCKEGPLGALGVPQKPQAEEQKRKEEKAKRAAASVSDCEPPSCVFLPA